MEKCFGLPCAFHAQEIITNFCKNPQCFLPLCPKCIKIHLQDHKSKKSHAAIESIDLSLRQVESSLSNMEKMISRTGESIKDIQQEQISINDIITRRVSDIRNRIMKEVDRYIVELNQEINRIIVQHTDSTYFKLKEVDAVIRTKLSKVWEMQDSLCTQKCLKTLITFHATNFIKQIQEEFKFIQQQLFTVNSKKLKLTVDSKQLIHLRECLTRLINIRAHQTTEEPQYQKIVVEQDNR